jgi:hypothetical protein
LPSRYSVEPEPELLSVAALPAVEFPTIQIVATLPGASPETMGASVVLFYNTLRHGMGYAEPGASYYEDRYWPT